jgi:hypothetical protein
MQSNAKTKNQPKPGIVVHAYNPSTQKADTERSWAWGQSGSKFQAILPEQQQQQKKQRSNSKHKIE